MKGPETRTVRLVLFGLIIEEFGLRMTRDGRIDLFAAHPGLDVWIIRDRLKRDMGYLLVTEIFSDITFRIDKFVEGKFGPHYSLARQRERDTRSVDCDPASTPLFSHACGRSRSTCRIEYEISRFGLMSMHRSMTRSAVCTTYVLDCPKPTLSSVIPDIVVRFERKILKVPDVRESLS